MRPISKIILHCTATFPGQDIGFLEVDRWHRARGFDSCGYHYIVRLNGQVEIGRTIDVQGAHCKRENFDSIGIAYVGGLDHEGNPENTLYECQRDSIDRILDSLACVLGTDLQIYGHRDFNKGKSCPNFDAQAIFSRWALSDV